MLMTALRSAVFDVCFFIWAIIGSVTGYVLARLKRQKQLRAWCRFWCNGITVLEGAILNLHYTMSGRELLPPEPYILAAKHQSAWEAMKLPALFPDCAIVLKESLLRLPFWGVSMEQYGAIPVARSRKTSDLTRMLRAADKMVADKRSIAIFPQGTRVAPGDKKPYHRGVAMLYVHLNLPVVPMQVNSGLFWGKNAFLKRAGTIEVKLLPPIPAGLPREELMQRLEAALEE